MVEKTPRVDQLYKHDRADKLLERRSFGLLNLLKRIGKKLHSQRYLVHNTRLPNDAHHTSSLSKNPSGNYAVELHDMDEICLDGGYLKPNYATVFPTGFEVNDAYTIG